MTKKCNSVIDVICAEVVQSVVDRGIAAGRCGDTIRTRGTRADGRGEGVMVSAKCLPTPRCGNGVKLGGDSAGE